MECVTCIGREADERVLLARPVPHLLEHDDRLACSNAVSLYQSNRAPACLTLQVIRHELAFVNIPKLSALCRLGFGFSPAVLCATICTLT